MKTPFSHFDLVDKKLADLQYMKTKQALIIREFIQRHNISQIIEIGFFRGKSSAYLAAILEDIGRGHLLTIDKSNAREYRPNIIQTLESVGLSHRVTPVFAERSYTWELGKLIRQSPRQQFDLCYFDGGHTWDATGFGFLLIDMLLKPGAWVIFDDMDWTVNKTIKHHPERSKHYKRFSSDEKAAPNVRLVFENLVPHLGYQDLQENESVGWGFARKGKTVDSAAHDFPDVRPAHEK